jgi:putative ABC transport system substrate-binding protein
VDQRGSQSSEHFRGGADQVAARRHLLLEYGSDGAIAPETSTIPIVFAIVSDPLGAGFVASLRRPGGNITGFTNVEAAIGGKWLNLLKEIAPGIKRPHSC